ncbi:ArnT family glycosyltransferase [Syntrophorhabdus aromaticivorans]|uniref:Phospholipid carrier-dependent glycosyltransferase n=1 Tax=Syntrophorhabdus aromaticivorans TaxID=328301 RepID=A0A971S1Q4_9BACT|nr:glycosyltransferase family 39 protein [Syntrophorhabdus aromaticivorans]NLW35492.1 phospholipid carrier-dependent glycosyltransferase [Syntrophorhabdus aromaticivorans]
MALTFKALGGAPDKVAGIPSALFAFATVIVLFFVANSIFGPRVALLSGLILATVGEYFRVAHWIIVDTALTFFVVSAIALFLTGYLSENSRKKLLCYTLVYVAATLAFYSKGFIGIVIPGLSILAFLALERNLREIARMHLRLGMLIFLIMTLPWFIALWQQAGMEYLNVFFVHNHLQRSLPAGMAGRISGSASSLSPGYPLGAIFECKLVSENKMEETALKILILGISGFIGNSMTARALKDTNREVCGMDIRDDKPDERHGAERFHLEV